MRNEDGRKVNRIKVGIVGAGGIGLASAAWAAHRGHGVSVWAPSGSANALRNEPLSATGALEATLAVGVSDSAQTLADQADVILIAVPLNAHKAVMDALLPNLRSGHLVIVSSMGSLSSLYLYERAVARGIDLCVASFGTTALTARRKGPTQVHIMTRRSQVAISCLPQTAAPQALAACEALFGDGFNEEKDPLVSSLANTSAITHVPLALFNWTRIERAENWPQYHYMTPRVSSAIEAIDAERLAVAGAFGIEVRSVKKHFSQSFKAEGDRLEDIAAELHKKRGGPPGPTRIDTRYLSEDVPYGLVFLLALGRVANVNMPYTQAMISMAELIVGEDFLAGNDLVVHLELASSSVEGLLSRVRVSSVVI
jgi:opine dehydrogenase